MHSIIINPTASGDRPEPPPPFNPNYPLTIPDCKRWFDAFDPLKTGVPPADGTPMPRWYDKSTAVSDMTQISIPSQPIYQTSSVLNSKPCLRFDGIQSQLQGSPVVPPPDNYHSLIIVYASHSQPPYDAGVVYNGNAAANGSGYINTGGARGLLFGGITYKIDSPIPFDTPEVIMHTYDFPFFVSSSFLYVDNVNTTIGNPISSMVNPTVGFCCGGWVDAIGGGFADVSIGEIIYYKTPLTSTQADNLYNLYLVPKWGF